MHTNPHSCASGSLKRLLLFILLLTGIVTCRAQATADDLMISYTVDPAKQDLRLFWKDDSGHILGSIQRLKDALNHRHNRLVFAMNGGMFKTDRSPQGLFIQQSAVITPIDTTKGAGNFYLLPNGIFYVTRNHTAAICKTQDFTSNPAVKLATQSGPMLVIDGAIHPAFKKGSANLNIRNGVGILPGNRVVFAMSKEPVNFYDFAAWFQRQGCRNALYLDGFVSRTYLPEKQWLQTDGDFGVMIGVVVPEQE